MRFISATACLLAAAAITGLAARLPIDRHAQATIVNQSEVDATATPTPMFTGGDGYKPEMLNDTQASTAIARDVDFPTEGTVIDLVDAANLTTPVQVLEQRASTWNIGHFFHPRVHLKMFTGKPHCDGHWPLFDGSIAEQSFYDFKFATGVRTSWTYSLNVHRSNECPVYFYSHFKAQGDMISQDIARHHKKHSKVEACRPMPPAKSIRIGICTKGSILKRLADLLW